MLICCFNYFYRKSYRAVVHDSEELFVDGEQQVGREQKAVEDHEHEILVVAEADAAVDEGALSLGKNVVVHLENAVVALRTVVAAVGLRLKFTL